MELESDKDGRIKTLKVIDIRTYSIHDAGRVLKIKFEDASCNPHVLQFELPQDQTEGLTSLLAIHGLPDKD